jgi:hypothetical protein
MAMTIASAGALAACGGGQAACRTPPSVSSAPATQPAATPLPPEAVFHPNPASAPVSIGSSEPFQIYTHCGVTYADFDGKSFYADPILDDGSGNPPNGWGNPFDNGTMTLKDQNTAQFMDGSGNCAWFSTQPRAGIPTIAICQ